MKRDMDLIRELVIRIENAPEAVAPNDIFVDGYTEEQVEYHKCLLVEAGLAVGEISYQTDDVIRAVLLRLTWAGHEFAAEAGNDKFWVRAKTMVKDKVGTVSMGLVTQALTSILKSAVGLP